MVPCHFVGVVNYSGGSVCSALGVTASTRRIRDLAVTSDDLEGSPGRLPTGWALAEEIRLVVDEGVVQGVQDVDLCMLLGAGWPFRLGGISAHLDRTGVSEAVTSRRFLPPGVASQAA
jgi:hypothetical protein